MHSSPPETRASLILRLQDADGRSDLFSLGCVLYALCTGHPPFRAETSYAVLRRITDDTARPIRELNPDIPDWLERMVMKLLSKSPADRFESAEEVAQLLENCLAHAQHPTSVPLPEAAAALSPKRNGRPPWFRLIAVTGFAFTLIFAAVLIVLEWDNGTLKIESGEGFLKAKEVYVRGTGKVMAFVPQGRQQSVSAVELWISGNDAPLVQKGDHVRLQFEGWPAVQSAGSFGGEVITIDPTADGAGRFRILVKADGNDSWPDERYLRQGVRAKGWVLTGSVATDVASTPSQEGVQVMQVNAAEATAGSSAPSHEMPSVDRSTYDAFLSEVEARHGKQLSEAERQTWRRHWHAFGKEGLADIHALATFSQDGQHLFTVCDRRVQVFRCEDGELVATIPLPQAEKSYSPATVRRLTMGLEGHHYCGRFLQGYQDVRGDEGYVSANGTSIGPVTKSATHNWKMQFHHPAFLRPVHDGTKLLAGIAHREAFLIDTAELIRGENPEPEVLFRSEAKTELSSFVAALDKARYVFFQEDVQIPETRVQSNGKTSDPYEQRTAGRLELFDLSTGKFAKHGAIELENPIPRKLRKRFQVFTLMEPKSRNSSVRGIQVGCLIDERQPDHVEVPYRRFIARWDEGGVGTVAYDKSQILNAQPQVISPGLQFYMNTIDRQGFSASQHEGMECR